MSTLPGNHYCKRHQGDHSHYDPPNCVVCSLRAALVGAVDTFDALYNKDKDQRAYDGWVEAQRALTEAARMWTP